MMGKDAKASFSYEYKDQNNKHSAYLKGKSGLLLPSRGRRQREVRILRLREDATDGKGSKKTYFIAVAKEISLWIVILSRFA